MSQEKQPTLHRQLLLGIFVVSGFSGLIYESIWSHYLSGRLDSIDPATALNVLALRASAQQCLDPGVQKAWFAAVRGVAELTTPYLTASELQPTWQAILAGPCYRAADEPHRVWVDLLGAVALRDASGIVQAGQLVLARQRSFTPAELSFVVASVAAAQIHVGDLQQAAQLLERTWTALDHSHSYSLLLRQLLAIAPAGARAPQTGS